MQLDRLTVALRPRSDFEAVDLGLRLAQRHIGATFTIWMMASLPWVAVVLYACAKLARPELAIVILWWIKPMFERPLLHVYSRAVFGDTPGRREWLSIALRQPYTAGFLSAITWRRLELSRAFNLPVRQLEGLSGGARRRRLQVLHLNTGSTAFTLSLMCHGLVWLMAGTLFLLGVSILENVFVALDIWNLEDVVTTVLDSILVSDVPWSYVAVFVYWLCEGVVAPYFTGAGFTLYLNRRTHLEAWDVEVTFRQMLNRRTGVASVVVALLCSAVMVTPGARAGEAPDPLGDDREARRTQIEQIVDSDDFGHQVKRLRWVPKTTDQDDDDRDPLQFGDAGMLANIVGVIGELAIWLGVALVVVLLIRSRDRWLPFFMPGKRRARRRTAAAGGLLLSAEELPADIPAQVRSLWASGQYREALSLLYRGALTVLNDKHELALTDSDTEGDCERVVRQRLDAGPAAYFGRIALAWQQLAYGHAAPDTQQVTALCEQWPVIEGTDVE